MKKREIYPKTKRISVLLNKKYLDSIYKKYTTKVNRDVEGFVINYNNSICKYVRIKNGKLVEYSDSDHKGVEQCWYCYIY